VEVEVDELGKKLTTLTPVTLGLDAKAGTKVTV
jgi:hypothetical protein